MGLYTKRRDLFGTKTSSDTMSEVYWVGDAETISLWMDGATQHVQGSNDEGRASAIGAASWSTLTTIIPTLAMLDVAPGFRWLRVYRSGSTGTAILQIKEMGW